MRQRMQMPRMAIPQIHTAEATLTAMEQLTYVVHIQNSLGGRVDDEDLHAEINKLRDAILKLRRRVREGSKLRPVMEEDSNG
jgi:hypothetical protein